MIKKIITLSAVLFWLFLFTPLPTLAHSFADLPGHDYTTLNIGCNSAADCKNFFNLSCSATEKFCYLNKLEEPSHPATQVPYPNLNCYYEGAPAVALCGEINCNITNPQANPKGECLYGKPNAAGTKIIEAGFVQGKPDPVQEPFKMLDPLVNLQIKIPGLDKIASETPATCSVEGDQTSCSLPWIAVYVKAIYNYAMGIIGILAALALMIGGVIYLTATGNATRISEAKSWITGALTGMLIMFTSYVLLNEVNPELIGLKPIEINIIEDYGGDTTVPSEGGGYGAPFSGNSNADFLIGLGIHCPGSGGSNEINAITKSFQNKIVYRLGSKNGKGSEANKNKTQTTYGLSCPNAATWGEKVVCYDCSGYVRQILMCAGFTTDPGMGTSVMFPGTEEISTCSGDLINGKQVNPGDLLGWSSSGKIDPKTGMPYNDGHVLIYSGNNQITESHGKRAYPPAEAWATNNMCDYINKKQGTKDKENVIKMHIKRLGTY